ncbi:response regulator [Paenibacillus sp. 19GGS1-52]|uniref:response regulator n=1 Tax=Paenibacillus sp. 19GGS1-52 TaxID=2758563 RepID=UPI001EFBA3F0|nr:response regulator [Paenibacillus sp. 19GGS1-52]ULO09041.1 response regulator [Paenibacillus sp. 19GGS1-52]
MHRVIIVEDEFIVRYGIRSMIDWEKIGLDLIGEAANGKEALELIATGMPDILITDIKMPVMDGIELIAEVRRISPDIKIIILSNLEDFQYAKEAIKHGVSEYMIKSDMMPRDFEQALLKIKENLDAARNSKSDQTLLFRSEPAHKESFLLDLLERGSGKISEEGQILEKFGLSHFHPTYLLHISLNASELGYAERQSLIRRNLEQEGLPYSRTYEIFPDRQGEINVLFSASESEGNAGGAETELLRHQADQIIHRLFEQNGLSATLGISGRIREWSEVKIAYAQAVSAVKQKLFLGSGRVIVHGSDDLRINVSPMETIAISSLQVQSMVYAFQSKEITEYIEQLFEQLAVRRDAELVQIISLELLMILMTLWPDVSKDAQQVLELKKRYFEELSQLETLEQSRLWFIQAFDTLVQHMIEIYKGDRSSIIKATQYIQQYYHQEISLQSISSLVHLSKNYFANLFKKEVGESFLEYLTRIRIEKAKTLLTGELKAGEVGGLVGIQDPKYFSKVFKKITGLSPSEYRSLVREIHK